MILLSVFSLRSRERSEAREARAGDSNAHARDTPKKSVSMGQIQPGARQQDVNGNAGQQHPVLSQL